MKFDIKRLDPNRTLLIAEAGVNHNGQVGLAKKLVDLAVDAGVDAVKFQTFKAEKVIARGAPKADYQQETTGSGESQLDMVRKLQLSYDDFRGIFNHAREKGLQLLSTAFDFDSVDFLEELGVPAFKIPSGEITNLPFLRHVARKQKPMILSTGMSDLNEVQVAVSCIQEITDQTLVLLHCVSNYPASPESSNLRAMDTMRNEFALPVGFSDHTQGIEIAFAAAARGACIVEKHFTLDQSMEGPDHKASMSPRELKQLVKGLSVVAKAMGDGCKRVMPEEKNIAAVARRSLVAACDIQPNTALDRGMISILRPGTGIPPGRLESIVGKTTTKLICAGTMLAEDMFE